MGWAETALEALLASPPRYGINAAAVDSDGRHPAYLRITDIRDDGRLAREGRRAVDHPQAQDYLLTAGDIVVARTGASVGKAYMASGQDLPVVYAGFLIRLRVNDRRLRPAYLAQFLRTRQYWNWITENSARSGQPGINGNQLRSLPILHPVSVEEQGAIAQALSDADALIEGLEHLVEKKRRIKEGAKQELLTGKRRLPGFNGKWKRSKLAELGSFLKGQGVSRASAQSGNLPCVRYGELYTLHKDVIRSFGSWISEEVASSATRLLPGDILFAGSGETKLEIGKAAAFVGADPAYAGGDIVILRPTATNSIFLGYAVNQPDATRQKASRGQGDAVVHIGARALGALEIDVPPSIQEQGAIGQALEAMEAEISWLEARTTKVRQVKEGMMQELLNGRIRLA